MEHEHDHSVAPAKEPSQLHEGTQSEDQSEDQIDEVAYPGSGTVSLEPSDEKDEGRFDSSVLLPLVALAFTYVGSQITQFFIATSGLFIAAELNIESDYSWLGVALNIGYVAAAPSAGYLQDIFGRRNALIIGSIFDILGNVIVSTSHSFAQVTAGSAVAGVGSAITELTTLAAMAELVPVRMRGLIFALNTSLLIIFTPSLLYTELIATHTTWRWCFYICLIWTSVAFVGLLATYVRLKAQRPAVQRSRRVAAKSMDYVGIVLLATGVVLVLVGLQSGGNEDPWVSAAVLCELIIGCILIALVPIWERFFATAPLIPGRLFRGQRVIACLYIINFVSEMNYVTSLNLGPVVLKEVFNPAPVLMGLWGLPSGIGLALGAILFNVLISALRGRARELLTVAAVLMTTFVAAQAAVKPSNPGYLVAMQGLAHFGFGGIDMPAVTVVTAVCPEDLMGTAVALLTTIRTIGGAVGYTIFYNIFYSNAKTKVPQYIAQYALKAGLPPSEVREFAGTFFDNPLAAEKLPHVTRAIMAAAELGQQWALADSVRLVYYASIPFGVVAVILCVSLPSIPKLMSRKVLVKYASVKVTRQSVIERG